MSTINPSRHVYKLLVLAVHKVNDKLILKPMIVYMVINRKRAGVLQQLCVICCKADAQPGPTKRFLPKEQIFYFYLFKVTKQKFAKTFESHLRYMGRNSLHQHGKCSYSTEKSNWML